MNIADKQALAAARFLVELAEWLDATEDVAPADTAAVARELGATCRSHSDLLRTLFEPPLALLAAPELTQTKAV